MEQRTTELLHADITYGIRGTAITVRKALGQHHKEMIYHRALKEEFKNRKIQFIHEPRVTIYYPATGTKLGHYQPDFLVENKVLLEIKALYPLPSHFVSQAYDYIKNSEYEIILFINFGGPKLFIERLIFTNDRKPFLSVSNP